MRVRAYQLLILTESNSTVFYWNTVLGRNVITSISNNRIRVKANKNV